ncbi:MAG: peroxiredoxin family protein, partial [Planctomycetota bacterium]
ASYDRVHLARMMAESGDDGLTKEGLKMARGLAKEGDGKLLEQATKAHVLWISGEQEEALEVFEDLRTGAALAEIELPPFQRLAPLAEALELPADWRPEFREANDVALRMDLDLEELGPRHWSPPLATDWTLPDAYGDEVSLSDFAGRPVLVVNFLGFGCVHCVEQLQVLAPMAEQFAEAGIEIVAIGLEGPEAVAESLGGDPSDTGFPFRVLCDPSRTQFKAWRAYDDFEDIALHGTYLVDGQGRIRWIDISHLPFMDAEFLLDESRRLLGLPVRGEDRTPAWKLQLEVSSAAAEPAASTPEFVEPDGIMVAVQLDTAPHCQNCIADLRTICEGVDGFRDLGAKPNEAVIMVVFEADQVNQKALLTALEAGGRPGKLP